MIVRKRRSAAGFACLALATVAAIALVLGLLHPAPIVRAQGPQVVVGHPGIPLTSCMIGAGPAPKAVAGNNDIESSAVYFTQACTFSNITIYVGTADNSGLYSWGLCHLTTSTNCVIDCQVPAVSLGSSNGVAITGACTGGPATVGPGIEEFLFTGNGTTGTIGYLGAGIEDRNPTATSTSSSGVMTSPVTLHSAGVTGGSYSTPHFLLN